MVEKRFNKLHLCPSSRISHCSSCEEQLEIGRNQFCYECPKCGRVFECDEQFQDESLGRSLAPPAHLKSILREWKIYEMFSFNKIAFLGNVIAQFQTKTGKSVNYPCFLHNYFEMAPSEPSPRKKEIMEAISHHLPKSFAIRRRAKREFDEWMAHNGRRGTISVSNPTPTFVSN